MKKIQIKILKRLVCVAAALAISGGVIYYSAEKARENTVAVMSSAKFETPVIILDAGHGEYFLNIVKKSTV